MTKPLRAIIYACYSTDLQNPNSVQDQIDKCRIEARKQGWVVVGERADHGISGTRNDRPDFKELLKDVQARSCDIVLTESLDRISRDQEDAAHFFKQATYHDVEIYTLEHGIVNPIQLGFSSTMAAVFIDALAAKTHRGLTGKIRSGKSAGGRSYGYKVAQDTRGVEIVGELDIDEDEAIVIRRIFREFVAGRSAQQIAAGLNEDLIPSPRHKAGQGGHWKQNTINGNRARGTGILNNELYIGRRIWNRLNYRRDPDTRKKVSRLNDPDKWEVFEVPDLAILDMDLWEAAKERQDQQAKSRAQHAPTDKNGLSVSQGLRRRKYLLSGLLKCKTCQGNLTIGGGSGTRKTYYCANAKEKGPAVCSGMPGLRKDIIEENVVSRMRNGLLQEEAYQQFKKDFLRHQTAASQDGEAKLHLKDAQIREREAKKANLIEAVENGLGSKLIIEHLDKVDAELTKLKAQRAEATPQKIDLPDDLPMIYRAHVAELAETLSDETVAGRAGDALRDFINQIIIGYDADLNAHTVEFSGNLAEILNAKKPTGSAGLSTSTVKTLETFAKVGCGSRI
ncbi:recombinase family protein [Shimia litoralis]|uniref:Recombinase family protein n=1 Tax=Shimia litoralis TaxID=420403 RepID=A0A4U7MR98_9RHOB|nr:recombinase family protein [Shimia litoralis]TKZ15469.1 recombinase family protein [Shimia litoralis]